MKTRIKKVTTYINGKERTVYTPQEQVLRFFWRDLLVDLSAQGEGIYTSGDEDVVRQVILNHWKSHEAKKEYVTYYGYPDPNGSNWD